MNLKFAVGSLLTVLTFAFGTTLLDLFGVQVGGTAETLISLGMSLVFAIIYYLIFLYKKG